jgi:hypothetical protein
VWTWAIGLFEFEHSLCVDLGTLVNDFIYDRQNADGRIRDEEGAEAFGAEALRLADVFERFARDLRAVVTDEPCTMITGRDVYYLSCGA